MTEINLPGIQCACVEVLERLKKSPRGLQRAAEEQQLASAIHDLLEASYELETFHPSSAISSPVTPPDDPTQVTSPYLRLIHILEAVQRAAAQRPPRADPTASEVDLLHPAVHAVREDLAWARVESLSHAVVQLVQRRRESPRASRADTSRALPARSPPPVSPLPAPPSPGTPPCRRVVSGASAASAASATSSTASTSGSRPQFPSPYQHGMHRDTSKSSYTSSVSTLVREAAASKSSLASVQSLQSQQSLGATEAQGLVRSADSDTVASVIERLHRIAPHLEGQWQRTMDMQELDDIINRVDRLDIGQKADWTIRRQEKVSLISATRAVTPGKKFR